MMQLSFPTRQTQQDRILNLLRSKEWVPLPEILDLRIAKYSSRIAEARRHGYVIENKKERNSNGEIHSFYRLLVDVAAAHGILPGV